MYSIDIDSMYPSIPTNREALKVIRKYLNDHESKIDMFGFKVSHIMVIIEFMIKIYA